MSLGRPYRARSISGAQQLVRRLCKRIEMTDALLERYAFERKLMAKLAADTPQFDNPIVVSEAKRVRDEILGGKR